MHLHRYKRSNLPKLFGFRLWKGTLLWPIRGVSAKGVPFSGLTYINGRGFTSCSTRKPEGGGGTPLQEANRNVPLDAGSHFHDWIRYNGVVFSIDLLEWGRKLFGFLG